MCNSCMWGGITFPNFVGQSCCNPCCKQTGGVGGESTGTGRKCCFCFDCEACPGMTAGAGSAGTCGCKCGGASSGGTPSGCCKGCGCKCGCHRCGG